MNEDTSWMKPEIRTSGHLRLCSWTGHTVSKTEDGRNLIECCPQLSQLMMGSSFESWGQLSLSWVSQSFLSSMLALLHLILWEGEKVGGKADELAGHNEPFCGVVLVPLDGVAVVHGELVVEVMVALTNGDQSGDKLVLWCMLVIKRHLAEVMSKAVDTEH